MTLSESHGVFHVRFTVYYSREKPDEYRIGLGRYIYRYRDKRSRDTLFRDIVGIVQEFLFINVVHNYTCKWYGTDAVDLA